MSEVKRILEHGVAGFEPRPDALGLTLRRARRRRWSRRLGATAAALAVAGGLVAGLWVAFRPGGPAPVTGPTPPPGVVGGRIGGQRPIAMGFGSVWAITCDRRCGNDERNASGRLVRIDPRTDRLMASVPIAQGQAVAAGEGGVWVIDFWHGTVTRVDPNTNTAVATIQLQLPFHLCENCPNPDDFLPFDLTTGADAVWVITDRGAVARIDPRTDRVDAYIRIPGENGGGIAVVGLRVWVTMGVFGVWAIDPATNRVVAKVPILDGRHPVQVEPVAASGAVWAAGSDTRRTGDPANPYAFARGGAVARIDPATGQVTETIHFDRPAYITAADERSVWVVLAGGDAYYRIDTGTNDVSGPFSFGGTLRAVGYGWGWVVSRGGTLTRVALP